MDNNKNLYLKVKEKLKEKNIGGMILFPSSNQYYLTGFKTHPGERLLLTIIPTDGEPFFIAPKLYESQVKAQSWIKEIVTWVDDDNPYEIFKRTLEGRSLDDKTFLVDDTMFASQLLSIIKAVPKAKFESMGDMLSDFRLIKSQDEIEKIRLASKIVDEVLEVVKKNVRAGMTEIEVAALMEYEMRKRGSEGPSFETIVGSGTNSALPHYNAGERELAEGDFVVLDFGGTYKGYCSDTTRTISIGSATEEMKKVYNIVKEAQEIGVKTARPGIKAKEIDKAVRDYITERGYGEYFTHRTGHGLGLEVHEEPYISSLGETILKPGMVFSIEPGIYIEGKFGVRIEDIVVVTEDGCERLNNHPRELAEIGI